MADRKISDLTALTAPASGDYVPIVDISEAAAASKNKRVTIQSLFQGIPVNVGIGTSSPQAPLHVIGAEGLRVQSATSSEGFIRFVNTSGSISIGMGGAVGNNLLIYDRTNNQSAYTYIAGVSGSHSWSVNNTERLRIDSSGNVGIGTSSPGANYALEINGNQKYLAVTANAGGGGTVNPSTSSGLFFSWNRSNGDGESNIIYGTGVGATPGLAIGAWNGTTYNERLRIDSSGRVGIGTASPTTLLDVNADTVRVRTARTPASATATGATGEICWDANYIYICTATNTWKRSALSTW